MWSAKSNQKLHLMEGDLQVSVSVKTTVRIIFVVVVGNSRPSPLLAPGAADPENRSVTCSVGGSGSK